MTATVTYTCPHCGQTNPDATSDGAVDGPREYHAACWREASASMTEADVRAAWNRSPLED